MCVRATACTQRQGTRGRRPQPLTSSCCVLLLCSVPCRLAAPHASRGKLCSQLSLHVALPCLCVSFSHALLCPSCVLGLASLASLSQVSRCPCLPHPDS